MRERTKNKSRLMCDTCGRSSHGQIVMSGWSGCSLGDGGGPGGKHRASVEKEAGSVERRASGRIVEGSWRRSLAAGCEPLSQLLGTSVCTATSVRAAGGARLPIRGRRWGEAPEMRGWRGGRCTDVERGGVGAWHA